MGEHDDGCVRAVTLQVPHGQLRPVRRPYHCVFGSLHTLAPPECETPVVDVIAFGARVRAPDRPSPVRHAGGSDRPNCGSYEQDSGPRSQRVHVSRAYVAHMQRGDLARPEQGNQGLTQMLRFRGIADDGGDDLVAADVESVLHAATRPPA